MKQQLKSYFPESLLIEGKQEPLRHSFHEDCLMVDPFERLRILAARSHRPVLGTSLERAYAIPAEELQFFKQHILQEGRTRLLLSDANGRAMLVFGDLLSSSGLLLVLALQDSAEAVARMLHHSGRTGFLPSPRLASVSLVPHADDDDVYTHLAELFFYLDRILADTPRVGLRTKTLLIANFTGCQLDDTALPLETLTCPPAECERLVAFLLCAFLTLRTRDKGIRAHTDKDGQTLCYRVEPINAPCGTPHADVRNFPFLKLPTFHRFSVLDNGNEPPALELQLNASTQKHILQAAPLRLLGLRFVPT